MCLHDEHITTANALTKAWTQLAVCKLNNIGIAQLHFEMCCNFLGKHWVGASRVESHPFRRDFVDRFVHRSLSLAMRLWACFNHCRTNTLLAKKPRLLSSSGERTRTPIYGTKTRCPAIERPRSDGYTILTQIVDFGVVADSVSRVMGSLVKRRRKRMRKKKHKKMLRRTRHQRRK